MMPGDSSAATTTLYGLNLSSDTPTVLVPGNPSLASLLADSQPDGITEDPSGDMFIVNAANSLTAVPGSTTTSLFAQSVTPDQPADLLPSSLNSLLDSPDALTIDSAGDLFIANQANSTVTVVPAPGVTSVFGQSVTPDTPVILLSSTLSALLDEPSSIAIDSAGDLFVGNEGNSTVVVVPALNTTSSSAKR